MADLTSYDNVIVDDWAPRMEAILDNTFQLSSLLEKSDGYEVVGTDEMRVPLQVSRNEGIGSRSETGTLAQKGSQGVNRAVYNPKYTWGTLGITEVLAELAEKDVQKFLNSLQAEFEGLINDVGEDRDRQFWGDGSGLLGTCGTTTASTTVTMGSAADMRFIRVNMRVDILVKSTGAITNGGTDRKVTSKPSSTTFVIDGDPITTDSTYGVYRQGNKVLTTSYEANGIDIIIDSTGAVGGLNPATAGQEYWAAGEFGSIGTITEEEIQKGWDFPAENGYKSSPPTSRAVLSDYGSRREYGRLLQTKKQYVVPTNAQVKTPKLIAGGFDALEYNGTEWLADRKCVAAQAYILDKNHLNLYQLIKPGWKKRQGKALVDDGNSGYTARFRVGEQLGTDNRAAHAKLTGITAAP